MSQVGHTAESATEVLFGAGVFEFSQVRSTIRLAIGEPSGEEAERGFEILQLTAAEFSMLPMALMPHTLSLPLSAPLAVPGWAALAAITKGSCTLAVPFHLQENLLSCFAGDAIKIDDAVGRLDRELSAEWTDGGTPDDWIRMIEQVEHLYRAGGTTLGDDIAGSGSIRLQGVLWAAKAMTASGTVGRYLADLVRHTELTVEGGAAVR